MLNASADYISLKSNSLVIESDNFSLKDGQFTATLGKIGNWVIGYDYLVGSSTDEAWGVRSNVYLFNQDTYRHPQIPDRAADTLLIECTDLNTGVVTYPFYLWRDGLLHCGKLEASGGTIGNWQITNGQLKSPTTTTTGAFGEEYHEIYLHPDYISSNHYTPGTGWNITAAHWDTVVKVTNAAAAAGSKYPIVLSEDGSRQRMDLSFGMIQSLTEQADNQSNTGWVRFMSVPGYVYIRFKNGIAMEFTETDPGDVTYIV